MLAVGSFFVALLPTISLLLSSFPTTLSQSCVETQENPHCGKDFDSICCPYPNVCYWEKGGIPACCAYGQTCVGSSGGDPVITSQAPTEQTITLETLTSTAGNIGIIGTITSTAGAVYATVSGVLVGESSPVTRVGTFNRVIPLLVMFCFSLPTAFMLWNGL